MRAWRPEKEWVKTRPFRTQQRAWAGFLSDARSTPRAARGRAGLYLGVGEVTGRLVNVPPLSKPPWDVRPLKWLWPATQGVVGRCSLERR